MNYTEISKELSYALRHHPEVYMLEMDDEGYVDLYDLLTKLHHSITDEQLIDLVNTDSKGRYMIRGNKICALYGHSFKRPILKKEQCPPDVLFHGTAKRFIPSITKDGLLSMKRQYVHLSSDLMTAKEVGKRRDNEPIILKINAKKAYEDGIKFYVGNSHTWLCKQLPSKYIMWEEV